MSMKTLKSLSALILALTFILPCFAACNQSGRTEDTAPEKTEEIPSSDTEITTVERDETTTDGATASDATLEPGVTTVPEATTSPEATTAPESTTSPEATSAPEVTTAETPVVTEPPHTHSYSSAWSKSATQHWHECSCGALSDIASHNFSDWTITKAATETAAGEKYRTCSVCGYRETAVIPELNHTHSFASTWAYDETGHWHPCVCGEKFGTTNHTYGEWEVVIEATCVAVGSIKRTCSVCGFVETARVEKTAHTVVSDPAISPTCTVTGKTEGSHCSYCGAIVVKQNPIPATGHNFSTAWSSDGVNHWHECHCGEKKDITAHSAVVDSSVKESCTASGLTAGSHCSVCGAVIVAQQIIPAPGHSFGEWEITKEATEEEEGLQKHTCTVCGLTETEVIPKLVPDPRAKDITSSVKVSTVIEMYNGKLPVVRSDAQFIPAADYINSADEEGWKDPGTGTRSINIDGVPGWEKYFNDDFLYGIDDGFASFDYPCIWTGIHGPLKYSFTIETDGVYEFVIVGAAQIKDNQVDNDEKDRGFCISVDGGKKQQVNLSDTLAVYRNYTYTYTMSEEVAAQINTQNGINSLDYQMAYTYNIFVDLTKGEHIFEFWHLEYSGDFDHSDYSNSRINYAGVYVELAQ